MIFKAAFIVKALLPNIDVKNIVRSFENISLKLLPAF